MATHTVSLKRTLTEIRRRICVMSVSRTKLQCGGLAVRGKTKPDSGSSVLV